MASRNPTSGPLTNYYFLSTHGTGEGGGLKWQGQFLAPLDDGHYLAQLFDPADGAPSNMVVIALGQAAVEEWRIYADADDWRQGAVALTKRAERGFTRTSAANAGPRER